MTLLSVWTALDAAAQLSAGLLTNFVAAKAGTLSASSFTLEDECFLEGLLSRVWQDWSRFCRQCVVESCIGTTDGSGKPVAALPQAISEAHVSGAAINANQGKAQLWARANTTLRHEPTWGDVDVLVTIVQALRPANSTQLLAALSSGHAPAKAVQTIRNAAAHSDAQSFAKVTALAASYIAFPITHPTHALLWVEPTANDFLLSHAIAELSATARSAIG